MIPINIHELAVVFIGDFNPVIINPQWLLNKGLLQEIEANNANIEVIHNEFCKFSLDWADIEVTRNKFSISSRKEAFFDLVKDLAVSIFRVLKETPLKGLGINHLLHFKLTKEQNLLVGSKLAPFENWEGIMNEPRLLQMEMQEFPRKDSLKGLYRVKVSVSDVIDKYGVNISINDHYDPSEKVSGSNEMTRILEENWVLSKERAEESQSKLWKTILN